MGFSCSYERYNTAWDPNTTKAQQGIYSSKDGKRHWVSIATFSGYNIDHTLNKIDKIEFSFKQTGGSSGKEKTIGIYPGLSKEDAVKLRNNTASYRGFTIKSTNGSNIKIEVTDPTALSYFQDNFNKNKTLVFFSEEDRGLFDSIGQNSSEQDYSPNYLNIENLEINVYSSPKNEEATVTDVTLGKANTVTVINPISGHYYQVIWKLGSKTYTYPSTGLTGSTSINSGSTAFSEDWGSLFPNANSMAGTITLKVYSANSISQSNFLGERTYSVLFKVPDDYTPLFDASSFVLESSYYNNNSTEVYLDGLSKVKVSCSGRTSYGASISSITVTYGDSSYSYLTNSLENLLIPLTTKNSGEKINITIKDSRGKTITENSPAYIVINTYLPTLENYNIERCDSLGNLNSSGTLIKLSGKLSNATLASGSASVLDEESDSSTIAWNGLIGGIIGGFNTDLQYKIIINIQSNVYYLSKNQKNPMTRSYTAELPSAAFLLHFLKGGKSIGIGCAAEEPGSDGLITLGWPTTLKSFLNIESNNAYIGLHEYGESSDVYTGLIMTADADDKYSLINTYGSDYSNIQFFIDLKEEQNPLYIERNGIKTNILLESNLSNLLPSKINNLDTFFNHLSSSNATQDTGLTLFSSKISCYVHYGLFTVTGPNEWKATQALIDQGITTGNRIVSILGGFYEDKENPVFCPVNMNGMGNFYTGAFVDGEGRLYYCYSDPNLKTSTDIVARLFIYYV